MSILHKLQSVQTVFAKIQTAEGIAPLLLRIYLAPIFIKAGYGKLASFENTAAYFGNPDWGLGLPFPELMAAMAGGTELIGGWLILFGLATRLAAVPLMFTMVVAAVTAHWQFGWHALPESTLTVPWEWRMDLIEGANERKEAARSLLQEYGNYSWLTENGSITVLKNGIEFAATYFVMLLVLLFTGGGRYTSIDHFIKKSIDKAA
ncbi:MAG: DoxX family protein [Aliiglaciecola sp.]|uniref:HvfX family Cu-binding RiPP maturation protein n=1 Tax=Aliiglaciecola sp. M165 TaxID=2593649 RepID=UPI00117FF452|nr:DoxX family protein [Aliiglaciecola sp. M165]TRY30229.1 DoxX family protein [Aliiglaciecola sp. M165]